MIGPAKGDAKQGQVHHQGPPVWEDKIGGDGSDVFEEAFSSALGLAGFDPQVFEAVADGVHGESQEVHGGEQHGEVLLAVAEIMFEMIAVVLEDVEAFVVSRPEGFHLQPLPERCGSLSTHTAPIKQARQPFPFANARTDRVAASRCLRESDRPVSCGLSAV